MSAVPDPGGKDFEYDEEIKKIKARELKIKIFIFFIIDLVRRP